MGRPPKDTAEFRADAVALIDSTGIGFVPAGRDLGVSSETLRSWAKRVNADRGEGAAEELTTLERTECIRLRKRIAELEQDRVILVKAAVVFAREPPR